LESGAHRELRVLEVLARSERTTQRGLASQLGIAVGLANLYLKRLARKGHIKCVNVQSNRVRYLITPKGIAEKTRLTYEFMEYSLQVFREGRSHLNAILKPYVESLGSRIAIHGVGEAAELAYLCSRELGLEPVAIFESTSGGVFFGHPVRAIAEHAAVEFDLLVVATFDNPRLLLTTLEQHGISREKLVLIRDCGDVPPQEPRGRASLKPL
jgi:DNA-binding MarR family transcriptional regulator